jgi:hypothetical protein
VNISIKSALINYPRRGGRRGALVWRTIACQSPLAIAPCDGPRGIVTFADQENQLHDIERTFADRRQALEGEMRKANAELAAAIRASDTAGPDVEAAVHHFHDAMGALQTETIEHVFAMRKVLTPEQRRRFDDKIAQALTSDAE